MKRNKSYLDNGMYIQIPVENHNSHNFQPPCDGMQNIFGLPLACFGVPMQCVTQNHEIMKF